ncbi:MAG TPA: hypothetical protein VFB84_00765 [Micromonosporaceae bacterium]|nr:hypothetical protein [Micromonosporaceae bacterium]
MTASPVITLWAVPRSRSTAFERMMVERKDLEVVHEPFSYLCASGEFIVDSVRAVSLTGLLDLLLAKAARRRMFIKETTDYSYEPLLSDPRLYRRMTNTFLIRRPEDVVASYYSLKPEMERDEVGFDRLYGIFRAVMAATGEPPVVVDADDLMRDPQAMVQAYCHRVGLGFMPEPLRWGPSDRPEWRLTQRWHRDVTASTGFVDYRHTYPVRPDNNTWLAEVASYHRPFYEEMYAFRLAAAQTPVDTA